MKMIKNVIDAASPCESMGCYVRLVRTNFNPAPYCVELSPASFDDNGSIKHDGEWGTMDQGPRSKKSAFDTYAEAAAFIRLLKSFRDNVPSRETISDVCVHGAGGSRIAMDDGSYKNYVKVSLTVNVSVEKRRGVHETETLKITRWEELCPRLEQVFTAKQEVTLV